MSDDEQIVEHYKGSFYDKNKYLTSIIRKWVIEYHPIREEREFHGVNYIYGPIRIGTTEWLLELRLPSYQVFLKRPNKSHAEKLEFSLYCLNDHEYMPVFNSCHDAKFEATTTATTQEQLIGLFNEWLIGDRNKFELVFEANVNLQNFADGAPSDVPVIVPYKTGKEDKEKLAEFSAHRSVLSKGSPVFKAMFEPGSKFKEAETGVVRIENFSPETVRWFLSFIYYESFEVLFYDHLSWCWGYPELMELLDAAEQYQVDKALKIECGRRLLALITTENALELLSTGDRYHLEALKQGAMEFIRDNHREVIVPMNDEALEGLPHKLTVELLKVISSHQA